MIIATWRVAVTLLVGCNADYELERPVGTTATNVASRANNRTIATNACLSLVLNIERKYPPNWSKIHRTLSSLTLSTLASSFQQSWKSAPERWCSMHLETRSLTSSEAEKYFLKSGRSFSKQEKRESCDDFQ